MGFFQRMKSSIARKTEAVTQKFVKGLQKTSSAFVGLHPRAFFRFSKNR